MNNSNPTKGLRPGFLISLTVSLTLCLFLLWMFRTKPASAIPTANPIPIVDSETPPPPPPAPVQPATVPRSNTLEDRWGIQVASIALTMAGAAVELRYQILAPEKVSLLADAPVTAQIIDQTSGARIPIGAPPLEAGRPQHSRARSAALMMQDAGSFPPPPSRIIAGKTYSIQLPNPGGLIKTGNKAVVIIGDCQTGVLVVQ
jgi:hypothetical protein